MIENAPACCWYCSHLEKCATRCVNNPLYCVEFCAWVEDGCENFTLDVKAYNSLIVLKQNLVRGDIV